MRNTSRSPKIYLRKKRLLKLVVQYATFSLEIPTRAQFRLWVKAALKQNAEIVIRIVDEAEGQELNHQFRNKDYATNVLTFIHNDMQSLIGDIVLCAPVIYKEAQQQHKKLLVHYAHLIIHGVLHLQGYDHIRDEEAAVMEQMETQILVQLGYENPYIEHRAILP